MSSHMPIINKKLLRVLGLALILNLALSTHLCPRQVIGSPHSTAHHGTAEDILASSCEPCVTSCGDLSCASHRLSYAYSVQETGYSNAEISSVDLIPFHPSSDSGQLQERDFNSSLTHSRFFTRVFRL